MKIFHRNQDYTIKIDASKNEAKRLRDGEVFGPIPIFEDSGKYHGKDAYVRFGKKKKASIEITNFDPGNFKNQIQLYFLITKTPLETMQKESRPVATRYGNDNKIWIHETFEPEE